MKRKAITPVIAVVLLLMMTVGLVALTGTWIKEVVTQSQAGISTELQQKQQATFSAITTESAWNESGVLALSIKNSGSQTYKEGDVKNFRLYINGKPTTPTDVVKAGVSYKTFTNVSVSLLPGEALYIYTDKPLNVTDESIVINVKPPFGDEAVKFCTVKATGLSC